MSTLELQETVLPDERLELTAKTHEEKARQLIIRDEPSLTAAGEFLLGLKDLEKEVIAHHKPIKEASWKAHQTNLAAEKRMLEPIQRAEALVKPKIAGYLAEQQRIADEQKRIEEARIRKEEAEQRRLQEEALERDIEAAEASGATVEELKAIMEQPVALPTYRAPAAYVPPPPAAPKGIVTRETWRAEVTNIRALCAEIAAGRQPAELVTANMPALNKMAVALKKSLNIPGVRAVRASGVAAGRR